MHALLWCVSLLACIVVGRAAGLDSVSNYDLLPGDAAVTLKQFSRVSGVQIFYPVEAVRRVQTKRVHGRFTARDALKRMLDGTTLAAVEDAASGALAVRRVGRATPPKPPQPKITPAPRIALEPAPMPTWSLEPIRMNPFEVRSDPSNSYGALDSNSLTSFRIDLTKLPATTTVFTQTFMDDVAATSVQDVLVAYSGVVGADPNNPAAALSMPGDRDSSGGNLGIRGLTAAPPKRDGFVGTRAIARSPLGYTDNFSTERIEVIEGPQSLLYGAVGGGGVVNVVSKRAQFGANQTTVQTRVDQYGSKRAMLDENVGANRFAVRIVAATEDRKTVRYNLGNEFYGLYGTAAWRLGERTTVRIYGERNSNWADVAYTPSSGDLANFLPTGDPRRGQDPRYLALTHQLDDLSGALWAGPADYPHLSSLAGWWSSERIDGKFGGATVESQLGHGFSAQIGVVYSETIDDRFTASKNLLPAAGQPGAGLNPFAVTAIRVTPGDNWQSDRTKGVRATLLHEIDFRLGRWHGRSQTALGVEGSHQGPAFGSSGIDRLYYQADANWNPIVSPVVTSDYGRVPIGSLYFPVQGAIQARPLFRPGSRRITVNGQNYVLEPRIQSDPSRVSDQNPFGLVPNNPTAANPNGFAGAWNRGGETHDRQWYLANFTDWDDGRLTTLAGASVDRFTTLNATPGGMSTYLPPRDYLGYEIGASYRIGAVRGLRFYNTYSTAGLSAGTTKDFYGNSLRVPQATSIWPEIGFKYNDSGGRWAAQLAYNPKTKVTNETRNAGIDFFDAVNPAGINGRYNSGDRWVNVDRIAESVELVVTANPTKNWRMRFAATQLGGEITSTVKYRQLYNDQFYTTGKVVTYRDGTPVFVDPMAAGGDKTTPLTLDMINDPLNAYYANPDPDSGRITQAALITALTAVDPLHGSAATGVNGLPISAIQYGFNNPHGGEITVVSAGDRTTGINEYSLNLQNHYVFSSGPLRGWGIFADLRTYFRNRAYYTSYFPSDQMGTAVEAVRSLYRLPPSTIVGVGLSYRRNLGRRTAWTTQLNIDNLFDDTRVWVMPNSTNGANLNARLSAQPRSFVWTNSISW